MEATVTALDVAFIIDRILSAGETFHLRYPTL